MQEQLEQALERIKLVEQERDAFKTAAKNEEVARIAAEGRLPLPKTEDPTDEFASPKKSTIKYTAGKEPRVSLSTMDIVSSAASEIEIEELTTQVLWERQRADRAQEMVEFLQAECEMHCCPCSKTKKRHASSSPPQKRRRESVESPEPHEHAPEECGRLSPQALPSPPPRIEVPPQIEDPEPEPRRVKSKKEPRRSTIFCPREGIFRTVSEQEAEAMEAEKVEREEEPAPEECGRLSPQALPSPPPRIEVPPQIEDPEPEPRRVKSKKEPRRSTIFCPREGIFRTVSEQEAEAMEAEKVEREEEPAPRGPDAHSLDPMDVETNPRMYARTPSVDPPTFALLSQDRTSLQSLLNAPHSGGGDTTHTDSLPSIRSVPVVEEDDEPAPTAPLDHHISQRESPEPRPHTSATIYTVTTQVPVRDENASSTSSFSERLRTPSGASNASSFDHTNPALTPTMTREQALAKIRERRGRVRSAAQAAVAPSRKGSKGTDRRDVSAPTGKTAGRVRS